MEKRQPTKVHAGDSFAGRFSQDGVYEWREPHPPQSRGDSLFKMASPFHACGYCGSMHPTDLAEAIKAGATLEWSDRKYGWPHKVYVSGAPNPYAGMMEIRSSHTVNGVQTAGPEEPAAALTHGKFYTLHLQDATPEEREIIERAMGLKFRFDGKGGVQWIGFQYPWLG